MKIHAIKMNKPSLPVNEAQLKGVCRICQEPHSATNGNPFILNYGKEFAHENCLVEEAKANDGEKIDWCGLRDDPSFIQCCCNCIYHLPVHHHCCTLPKPDPLPEGRCVCGVRKGWACVCLAMADDPKKPLDGIHVYDNWPEHSCGCECYDPIDQKKHDDAVEQSRLNNREQLRETLR